MSRRQAIRPAVRLQWLGTVDEGRQLELAAEIDGLDHILLAVLADDSDESLWLEFEAGKHLVQIPLASVVEMLEAAPKEVHSEAWYERNVYPNIENT